MFSKQTVSTIIAPSGSFGGAVTINLNNPFLPANLRNQFCGFNTTQADGTYTPRFTQAECDAAAAAPGRTNADGSANADYPDVKIGEHTSELQSLMRTSYAAFCLNTK